MKSPPVSILLLGVMIVAIGSIIVWAVVRRFRRELGMLTAEREKTTDTSFIINAFQDVTRQLKEKEKELERLRSLAEQRADNVETYNENILQCVMNGVMTFDKDCQLTTINRAALEMLHLHREQTVGRTAQELFGDSELARTVRETLEKGVPSARMEAMLDGPHGRFWLGYNTAVLTDRQAAALGVIVSFSDLTEVKRLQEQVELRERLTALGEMSAGIAHELRNPMAVISGYLTLLSKKSDPAGQETIRSIASEINGMNRIIGDLLTFARPAALNRVKVPLKEMITGCLAAVLQAKGENSRIETILKLAEVEVSVDEVLMRQAVSNLLQNAVEAMPEGGALTIEAQMNGDVKIVVRDTGTGIPSDKLKKIFLPFYTLKDAGVGMGLALVHKIVTSHGGRIEVASTVGKGTVFVITLPKG
jgi:PAS domain S-box-containing protein